MRLDGLVMAGGRGTRLRLRAEKPLLPFRGKPLVGRVIEALLGSSYIDRIFVATSERTRGTERLMAEMDIATIRTPGNGYVEDLVYAVEKLGLGKVLTIGSDLPLITSADIDWAAEEYAKAGKSALTILVPREVLERQGLTPTLLIGNYVPSGVNILDGRNLDGEEAKVITEKVQFAFNVNTLEELALAEGYKEVNHARE
ncbi:MAG: NTP transferase domain-containing protein [Euryarchaeota archaeon]|nr:NTP transferase domain-containing protein [Euryarchaeota archaeon]